MWRNFADYITTYRQSPYTIWCDTIQWPHINFPGLPAPCGSANDSIAGVEYCSINITLMVVFAF